MRLIMLPLILLLSSSRVHSQAEYRVNPNTTSNSEPLPGIATLLAEVQANQRAIDEIRENYAYKKIEEETELGAKGEVKTKHGQVHEVFYVNGHEIQKLIARDGVTLSSAELEKEEQRVKKEVLKYTSSSPKQASRREQEEEDELHISTFLRAAKFTHLRRETFRGQEVIAMEIEPNPGYHPQNLDERLVQKLEGTMWIDRRAHQVVRLEAHLSGTARIAGGLLGSVAQGSAATFEQSLVNNEVWLPAYLEEHLSGRFLLFKSYRKDFVIHYKDYAKFRVDVYNEIGSPKPN